MIEQKKSSSRKFVSVAALLFFLALSAHAQRQERSVQGWKPIHYDVELNFDDQLSGFTSARTRISVEVLSPTLDMVDLDFGDLPIDSVLISEKPAQFQRTSETLNVMLAAAAKRGDKFAITVSYHGHPKDGLIFAKDRDGNPSATGDNWPNRVHYWIPSLDHPSAKATVSFSISAPQRYEVTANGKFITLTGNAVTSHWKFAEAKAIPPYCMIVALNQGAVINAPYQPVPLLYNVPQKDRGYAPKGFSPAGPALSFFSQTIAPYPYEKLALIIGATRFGGMENSSAIVFTSTLFDQRPTELSAPAGNSNALSRRFGIPTRIESVVAHEIAHQWFGDSVTESTWSDLWLSEGFATYFAALFIQNQDGEDAFHLYMRDAAQRYFNFEKQSASFPIHDTETKDLMSLLNPNNYEKGAWVLHMLRGRLGDDAFFKGLRDYYNAHKEANATTDDLRAALEKSSGKDLKEFFARWVYGSGHPRYELSVSKAGSSVTNFIAHLNQLQADDAFLDPVPVEFIVSGKKVRRTIVPTGKSTEIAIQLPANPSAITIDPDETLLKEVMQAKP
jgi:aminopeptidase N